MLLELFHRAIRTGVDFFSFWRLEKALTLPVFPGTSWPAHAQYGPDAFQPLYVIVAGIVCAAVGMMYQPKARLAILKLRFPERPVAEKFAGCAPTPNPPHAVRRHPAPRPNTRTLPANGCR